MKKYLILTTMLLLGSSLSFAQQTTGHKGAAVQWHFNGNFENANKNGYDWVWNMITTSKQEYICVGYTNSIQASGDHKRLIPVIFKLDKYGHLVWYKTYQSITGNGNTSNNFPSGILFSVIETPQGFAAFGNTTAPLPAPLTTSASQVLMVEVNHDGALLNPNDMVFNLTPSISGKAMTSFAGTISPDNSKYIVTAREDNGDRLLSVGIIDRSTHTLTNSGGMYQAHQ